MKTIVKYNLIGFAASVAVAAAGLAAAQGPGRTPSPTLSKKADAADLVKRMTAFDANGDGKLMKSEITDRRLERLFDRADADKDGVATKEELTALAEKEHSDEPDFDAIFPPGGSGGPPPGFMMGGPPPGFMMGGLPKPGEVLAPMLRSELKLSAEQTQKLDALQKDVDRSLDAILTADQKKQLKEFGSQGPRGFGPQGRRGFGPPPGGRRGPGGSPGGPPR